MCTASPPSFTFAYSLAPFVFDKSLASRNRWCLISSTVERHRMRGRSPEIQGKTVYMSIFQGCCSSTIPMQKSLPTFFMICPPHWIFFVHICTKVPTNKCIGSRNTINLFDGLYWSISEALSLRETSTGGRNPIHHDSISAIPFMFFPFTTSAAPHRQEMY